MMRPSGPCSRGKACYLREQYAAKADFIIRAQNVINELLVSLNMEAGGEIAFNLKGIYQFIIEQIIKADLKKDLELLSDLVGMLGELRAAWAQLDARPPGDNVYGQCQVQTYPYPGLCRIRESP